MKLACVFLAMMMIHMPESGAAADKPQPLSPIGEAKGIYPGRVVWVHNPDATDWKGPGDGHWWENNHTHQEQVSKMVSRLIRELTGAAPDGAAWDKLFRFLNQSRGKGDVGYKRGEKVTIKVNFVGFMGGMENYVDILWDYMNTSPQIILALLRQLVNTVGVRPSDITVTDTLAYFPSDYCSIFRKEFPEVRCEGVKAKPSSVPLYWSCRPQGCKLDYVPTSFAEAEYLINLANLKAHPAGVTLCAKNHYGSLARSPRQKGYYDLHPSVLSTEVKVYRTLVDLMGHSHIGGKTVLYLIDGLYAGMHVHKPGIIQRSADPALAPGRWNLTPFNGDWTSSLFASQDPVAIDSVGFDFLYAEYAGYPRRNGADDYLHEAALADHPPSGTFYDPDHATEVKRLASLGVHEHWHNSQEKKYSGNLGSGKGIELVAVSLGRDVEKQSVVAPGAKVEKLVLPEKSYAVIPDDQAPACLVITPEGIKEAGVKNLFLNGGFEAGPGQDGSISGWKKTIEETTLSLDEDVVKEGKRCLKVIPEPDAIWESTAKVQVRGGEAYQVGFESRWEKTIPGGSAGWMPMAFQFADERGHLIRPEAFMTTVYFGEEKKWRQAQRAFTVPPGAVSLTVRFYIYGSKAAAFRFDNMKLEKSIPRPSYTIKKARAPVVIDGDLKEWEEACPVVIDCSMDSPVLGLFADNKDCSLLAYFMWDEQYLYVAARIMDDQEVYGRYTGNKIYQEDTVQVWVNKCPVGIARTCDGGPQPWVWRSYIPGVPSSPKSETSGDIQAAYKLVKDLGSAKEMDVLAGTEGGSVKGGCGRVMECAIPHATTGLAVKGGAELRLAIQVDDQDAKGGLEGALQWPGGMGAGPENFQPAVLSE